MKFITTILSCTRSRWTCTGSPRWLTSTTSGKRGATSASSRCAGSAGGADGTGAGTGSAAPRLQAIAPSSATTWSKRAWRSAVIGGPREEDVLLHVVSETDRSRLERHVVGAGFGHLEVDAIDAVTFRRRGRAHVPYPGGEE